MVTQKAELAFVIEYRYRAIEHSIEKPILLNFVNFSIIFFP